MTLLSPIWLFLLIPLGLSLWLWPWMWLLRQASHPDPPQAPRRRAPQSPGRRGSPAGRAVVVVRSDGVVPSDEAGAAAASA